MKRIIEKMPLWLTFMLGSIVSAVGSVAAHSDGRLAETIACLFMMVLMAVCAGIDLMETKYKKVITELDKKGGE